MSIFSKSKIDKTAQINTEIIQPKMKGFPLFKGKHSALLIKQPWITERTGDLSNFGKYVFVVDKKANKPEVKKAVESLYGVKVSSVNILNTKGKQKRLGKSMGKVSGFKKAIVTLKKGEKIETTV
ncbi:MAG: 50S ribosomal protein L23 [Patescibacteria group bacterium]